MQNGRTHRSLPKTKLETPDGMGLCLLIKGKNGMYLASRIPGKGEFDGTGKNRWRWVWDQIGAHRFYDYYACEAVQYMFYGSFKVDEKTDNEFLRSDYELLLKKKREEEFKRENPEHA